jgi:hypothetical protein
MQKGRSRATSPAGWERRFNEPWIGSETYRDTVCETAARLRGIVDEKGRLAAPLLFLPFSWPVAKIPPMAYAE